MTTETKPTTKIVIVSGQEFSVPAESTVDELRAHLASMFPDVASATVQKGTKKLDGVTYETIEFVKKAGTKGASLSAQLAALLDEPLPIRIGGAESATAARLAQLRGGQLTIDEALNERLTAALKALPRQDGKTKNGGTLCSLLDALSPVAGATPSDW